MALSPLNTRPLPRSNLHTSRPAQLRIGRGIDRSAVRQHWQTGQYGGYLGWFIPFFDAHGKPLINLANKQRVTAFKTAPGQLDAPHDQWVKGTKPEGMKPCLLPTGGIIPAIAHTGGTVCGAEGHADFLTLLESGHDNALGFPGTSFVPDDLAPQLLSWGVQTFIYYCHPDAVQKVGQKIVNLLDGSGIAITIKRLPMDANGRKAADLNDLWRMVEFDRAAFESQIAELPTLDLKPESIKVYAPKAPARKVTADDRPRKRAWAVGALDGTAGDVARSAAGHHFDALKRAATRLGTIAANGLLDHAECEEAIIAACYQCGYIKPGQSERTTRAQFRCYFNKGLAHPEDANLPPDERPLHTEKRHTPALHIDPLTLHWPSTIPNQLDRALTEFGNKALAQVVRAMVECCHTDEFDLPGLVKQTGISQSSVYRVFDTSGKGYGLGEITQVIPKMTCSISNQSSLCHFGNKSYRPSQRHHLPPYAVVREWVLRRYIRPRLVEKFVKLTDKLLPEESAELARAVSVELDAANVDAINARLNAIRSDERKSRLKAAWDDVQAEYNRWQRRLNDLTCIPLPAGWHKDIAGAKVEQYAAPFIEAGKPLSLDRVARETGLSKSTVARVYKRRGIANDARYATEVISKIEALPEPGKYCPVHAGAPERVIFETGEILDYRMVGTQERAAQALAGGEKVRIDYRQAGIPRRMTDEERAALTEQAAQRTNKQQVSSLVKRNKPQYVSDPVHEGPGHSPRYARQAHIGMLIELGYNESLNYILYQGDPVAEKPFDKLTGPELIALLKGESLITVAEIAPGDTVQPVLHDDDDLINYIVTELGGEIISIEDTAPAPVPVTAHPGAALLQRWLSFTDYDARADWYDTLTPDEKWLHHDALYHGRKVVRCA